MSDVAFVTVNAEQIQEELITLFEQATGETLYPGDERRIFLLQFAQVLVGLYNKLNDTGRQNLLMYARNTVLDAWGERVDTPRLPAEKASCAALFTLSDGHPQVVIPAGTRISPDGKLFFATKSDLLLNPGTNTGTVTAEAAVAGSSYNGFTVGQINILVDSVPYFSSVSNTNTSSGGADEEADGSSVPPYTGYRKRIRESATRFSTAGPSDAYKYWAESVDQDISDVAVTSPSAGSVLITVLMKDGKAPSSDILAAVLAACSDEKRRPLTDNVSSAAPAFVTFTINFLYTISNERAEDEAVIRAAIENTGGAVDQYIAWQIEKLGRKINSDKLRAFLFAAGANTVTITAPVVTVVDEIKAAQLSGVPSITYSGLSG